MRPRLHARLDSRDWITLAPPDDLAPRAWLLGVVALQISVENDRVVARARAHVTGAEAPRVEALDATASLHVTLLDETSGAPPPPALTTLAPSSADARLELFLDGVLIDCAELSESARRASPPARGFGHVFCRWLRSGEFEPGFDLTDLVSLPPGRMFERRVNRPLAVGQTVSYRFARAG
ncbi:MAG TPA: hypothetical protein VFF06_01080 [Polyangia bacterium]|nr:hypothetical protein [Polyangia bacterium]